MRNRMQKLRGAQRRQPVSERYRPETNELLYRILSKLRHITRLLEGGAVDPAKIQAVSDAVAAQAQETADALARNTPAT